MSEERKGKGFMKKTARIFSLLMAAVVTAAYMPVSAAAEEEPPAHECTIIMGAAVDSQTHTLICEECGATAVEAHSFGDWNAQDAQCHVRVCSCGASVTEPHTWDDGVLDEASGVRTYVCTACSASYTETAEPPEKETPETSTNGETDSSTDEETPQSSESPLIGDVDGDGQVTARDAMLVGAISQGTPSSATERQRRAADINQDGWIDQMDVLSIYAILND